VHPAGSHNLRPITVEVTDETGRPLARAAVSFHLPDDGPGGIFLNGLHTEVAITDAAGRASIRGLQWNRIPGRFQIRIVASCEQARAGVVSQQYIEGPAGSTGLALRSATHGGHAKWLVIAALAAAGVAGGVLAAHAGSGTAAAASPTPVSVTTVGTPVITVLKP